LAIGNEQVLLTGSPERLPVFLSPRGYGEAIGVASSVNKVSGNERFS
jgi:hypothetical protein